MQFSDQFEEWWKSYPRRVGKIQAYKAWLKADKEFSVGNGGFSKVMAVLEEQKKQTQWQRKQFIPHPATYLNQGRWMDEIEEEKMPWEM